MSLPLILASTSVFKQQQLRQIGIPFTAIAPDFDETPLSNENAADTAARLAEGKARSLAQDHPKHLIIGADQVAFCDDKQLGKPMSVANAQHMLRHLSGKEITFYSAVCLLNTFSGSLHSHTDQTTVKMRVLSDEQIAAYLTREPDAIYCAGAAKSEGLGAVLLQSVSCTDPNALVGLPIFRLIDFLFAENFTIL